MGKFPLAHCTLKLLCILIIIWFSKQVRGTFQKAAQLKVGNPTHITAHLATARQPDHLARPQKSATESY